VVSWTPNPYAKGIRVHYAVHGIGTDAPLNSYKDVAANLRATILPVTVESGEAITVEVEPWSGWSGSAVSGTAGERIQTSLASTAAPPGEKGDRGPEGPQGPAGPEIHVPIIRFEVLPDSDPQQQRSRVRLRVHAENVNGPGIRLRYKTGAGTDFSGATVVANPSGATVTSTEIVLLRSDLRGPDRVLRARAETTDDTPLYTEQQFVVDADDTPEVVNVNVVPRPYTGVQIGWTAQVAVDDDTQRIEAVIEDTSGSGIPKLVDWSSEVQKIVEKLTFTTDVEKNITFYVDQDPGGRGVLKITPYDSKTGGNAGEPYRVTLQRQPVTTVTVRDVNVEVAFITLASDPDLTIKWFRITNGGTDTALLEQGDEYGWCNGVDGNGHPTYTSSPSYTRQIRFIVLRHPEEDVLVEFYSQSGDVREDLQRLSLDPDRLPDIDPEYFVVKAEPNRLMVWAAMDDDTASWRAWAKRGEWPTLGGGTDDPVDHHLLAATPDPDFLRFEGSRQENHFSHYASAGEWFVVAQGYGWSGTPPDKLVAKRVMVPGADTPAPPPLTEPRFESILVTGLNLPTNPYTVVKGHHELTWKLNDVAAQRPGDFHIAISVRRDDGEWSLLENGDNVPATALSYVHDTWFWGMGRTLTLTWRLRLLERDGAGPGSYKLWDEQVFSYTGRYHNPNV
jgi:hypothetical protein